MKNINNFYNQKYDTDKYTKVEEFIYSYEGERGTYYCTPITFEQEPEYEEGTDSSYISQYPLEDILDEFCVFVSDFFDELNTGENNVCYQEFSGFNLKDVQNLKNRIVGKHVYNLLHEEEEYVELIIE